MCVCVFFTCVWTHLHAWGGWQRLKQSVFLDLSLLHLLKQYLSTKPGAWQFGLSNYPVCPTKPLSLPLEHQGYRQAAMAAQLLGGSKILFLYLQNKHFAIIQLCGPLPTILISSNSWRLFLEYHPATLLQCSLFFPNPGSFLYIFHEDHISLYSTNLGWHLAERFYPSSQLSVFLSPFLQFSWSL